MIDFCTYTVLGLRRYMDGNINVPRKVAEQENKGYTRKFKKVLQVPPSTATAALYASIEDYGLGYPNRIDCQQLAAASNTFAIANANTLWARGFFNLLLNWTRQGCNIPKVNRADTSQFFDWDISKLSLNSVAKMKHGSEIITLLTVCMQQDLQVKFLHEDQIGQRWTLCPKFDSLVVDRQPESAPAKLKLIIQTFTSRQWARKLQLAKSQGRVVRLAVADKELSNAWRKKGVLSEAVWRWAIRATLDILPTSVHMCCIYKLWT